MNDTEAINSVKQGNANAYRYLVEKYQDMAYSLAFSIVKNSEAAEEVTQDAFLKAYQNLHQFEQRAKFSTWFYRIVTNEALKLIRKKEYKHSDDIDELNDQQYAEINNSIASFTEQEQRYYINKGLARLLPKDSLVLRLYYLEENSLKDVKEITGFTITNIKTILHRARKRFYHVLKDELRHELKSIL